MYRAPDGREVLLVFSDGSGTMQPIRDAAGAWRVGYLNADGTQPDMREAEYGWLPRTSLVPVRVLPSPPPFEDDPDGDNWHPADVADYAEATCRRCGEPIMWLFDEAADGPEPLDTGWWYAMPLGTEACTPGLDDTDRYHAPTTTPPPSERG